MAEEKKKGILSNLFGKKKEAEAEAARKAAEEAAQLAKSREEAAKVMEKAKAEAQAREAELKAKAEAEEEARKAEVKKQLEERAKAAEEARKKAAETAASAQAKAEAAAEAAKPKFIAEHTVGPDDTLSHIALKFYGSAGRSFWMHIYEANKAVIGDNPGIIRPGTVLQIPELTPELKELLK